MSAFLQHSSSVPSVFKSLFLPEVHQWLAGTLCPVLTCSHNTILPMSTGIREMNRRYCANLGNICRLCCSPPWTSHRGLTTFQCSSAGPRQRVGRRGSSAGRSGRGRCPSPCTSFRSVASNQWAAASCLLLLPRCAPTYPPYLPTADKKTHHTCAAIF